MRTYHDYLAAIRARHPDLKSDPRLAVALGLKQTAPFFWRHGRAFPSDDNMIKLADLAGVNPEEALADLNVWRAQSSETRELYSRIAAKIKSSMAQVLIFGVTSALVAVSSPASAEQTPHESTLHFPTYTLCDFALLWISRIRLTFQTTRRRFHQKFTPPGHVNPLIVPAR